MKKSILIILGISTVKLKKIFIRNNFPINAIIIFSLILITGCSEKVSRLPEFNYLGQDPPGMKPEIFAPGYISTRYHEHSTPNFSPDGQEMVYTLSGEEHMIMYIRKKDEKWSIPKPISFTGKYSDDGHVWSKDGTKLYFRSKRPTSSELSEKVYNNWVTVRVGNRWSDPVPNNFFAYSFSSNGNNYFYLLSEKTGWDIYMSKPGDNHQNPEKLDLNVNSDYTEGTPFIADDESYLIFSAMGRDDIIGIMDLYISFKKEDGTWAKAKNIGEPVNLPGHISRFPRISRDGKYLFYWSNIKNDPEGVHPLSKVEKELQVYKPWRPEGGQDGDIYWVSSKIIDKLKPVK